MVTEVERFQCSPGADAMWSRLLALYRLRRYDGDSQIQGRNWAEWEMHQNGSHSDLGTEARLLFIACVGCLTRLEEQGMAQQVGVALARRRLSAQRVTDIRQRYGLTYDEAEERLNMVREWLAVALGDDPCAVEQLELPWDSLTAG